MKNSKSYESLRTFAPLDLILSVCCTRGAVHDFKLFKQKTPRLSVDIEKLVNLGYFGIKKYHENVQIPHKKTKKKQLSKEQKKYNRQLAQRRVAVENVIRKCKIWRIVKETYRGKHKNYSRNWNTISALVNLRYSSGFI